MTLPLPADAVSVFVSGVPIAQGSAKGYTRGTRVVITHDNPKTRPWRADVHAAVRAAIGPAIAHPVEPVAIRLAFVMPRPKAEPKRSTRAHTRAPDLDKLVRAILDSLTGLVYTDDRQVIRIVADKRTAELGEQPGVHITWRTWP